MALASVLRVVQTLSGKLTNANGELVDRFPSADDAKASVPGVSWRPDQIRGRCWNGWLGDAGSGRPDYVITFVPAGRGGFRRVHPEEAIVTR